MDYELRISLKDISNKSITSELPLEALSLPENEFRAYIRNNLGRFSQNTIDACRDWEIFLKDYTTAFNEQGIIVLRSGFFLGYKSYFNRFCNEILDGINHNESLPFSA